MSKTYSAGKSIDEIKKQYGLSRIIKLASNENNYGAAPAVLRYLKKESKNIFRYPDNSYSQLKSAIAEFHNCSPNNVILGNGSDELLFVLLNYLVKEKETVLIPKPSFQVYPLILKNNHKKFIEIPLKNWQYDLDGFRKNIQKNVKMIVLCNPNNPTGTYITHSDLEKFLKDIPSDIYVVLDEAYVHFADTDDFPDSLHLLKKYKNLIILRTGSKFFGLAGLRFGFGFASSHIADLYNFYKLPFSNNKLLEHIGPVLFEHIDFYEKIKQKILKEKQYLYSQFDKMNISYLQSMTNFIFLYDVKSRFIFEELLRKGIIIRELSSFGIKNALRVTVGLPSENRKFIKELKKLYESF